MIDQKALDSLVRRFFAEPNSLHWDDIEGGRLAPAVMEGLQPWLDRLRTGDEPVFLPYVTPEGPTWYVATYSSRAFRHAREEMVALLGRTYSDFGGQPTHLDKANPIEAALVDTFGLNVLRIKVPRAHKRTVRSRLHLLAKLFEDAPQRMESLPRPVGRILSEFEEALRRKDDLVAKNCITELKHFGHLDARNLLYLRIRRDEGRLKWQEILEAAHRYHLVTASRRPRRVSQAILRAVYATELASFEEKQDAAGALREFSGGVFADYGPLLVTRTAYQCPEADALFLMRAVNEANTRDELTGALDGIDLDAPHRSWLVALIEVLPPRSQPASPVPATGVTPVDSLAAARDAFFIGALDEAWDLLEPLAPSEATVQLIISCACDIGTLSAAQRALDAFVQLPAPTRDILQQRNSVATNLDLIRKLTGPVRTATAYESVKPHIPQSWTEWIDAISTNQQWQDAAIVAERGAVEWDPAEFQKIESVTGFTKALTNLDNSGHARLLENLPYLLSSISRCTTLPRKLGPALETLTLIHLCDEASGRLFFGTLADLCNLTLSVGVTRKAYTNLLTDCISAITTSAGAADFDGLLEFLDVLVMYSSPDTSQRTAVVGVIAELFVRYRGKATPIQLILLRQLLRDVEYELPSALIPDDVSTDDEGEGNPLASLAGKTIALYSLRETVLHCIADLLTDSVEGINVKIFHDKVGGSSALQSAARNADVFVIATSAATHAATSFIESERGSHAVTLKPDGQGSSSMLRKLYEYSRKIGGESG